MNSAEQPTSPPRLRRSRLISLSKKAANESQMVMMMLMMVMVMVTVMVMIVMTNYADCDA